MGRRPVRCAGRDVMPAVRRVRRQMNEAAAAIRGGLWRGHSGRRFKHIVHIGIGGSGLGPRLAVEALEPYRGRDRSFHFVSNLDGEQIAQTLKSVQPERTLFIVASKSFTTEETRVNADTARDWLVAFYGREEAVADHFVAVTSNPRAAEEFGIRPERIFEFWDWVGGRFSLTSAVGLPVLLAVGRRKFLEMLRGFYDMDAHFFTAPFEQNLPVIMGMLGVWYVNFFSARTRAVIPYSHLLRRLPAYLQQAEMESNGKSVDRQGRPVPYHTAPVVWGEPGTDGQHAFFQLLHQGTQIVPCDFIGFRRAHDSPGDHQRRLTAHLLAQTRALAFGRDAESLRSAGVEEALVPFRTFAGNRPSTTILADRLTPRTLGQLIALYEHQIFVEGVIWNIHSFDQWGVELGKALAREVYRELAGTGRPPASFLATTRAMIMDTKQDSAGEEDGPTTE